MIQLLLLSLAKQPDMELLIETRSEILSKYTVSSVDGGVIYRGTGRFVDTNPLISPDANSFVIQNEDQESFTFIPFKGQTSLLSLEISGVGAFHQVMIRDTSFFVGGDFYHSNFSAEGMSKNLQSRTLFALNTKTASLLKRISLAETGVPFLAGSNKSVFFLNWDQKLDKGQEFPKNFKIYKADGSQRATEYRLKTTSIKDAALIWSLGDDDNKVRQLSRKSFLITSEASRINCSISDRYLRFKVLDVKTKKKYSYEFKKGVKPIPFFW